MSDTPIWIAHTTTAWDAAVDDPAHADAEIERMLRLLFQEARTDRGRRLEMQPAARSSSVPDKAFRRLLLLACQAVEEWCAGDYAESSSSFSKLARLRFNPKAKDNTASLVLRIHALTWQAACVTRLQELDRGQELLSQAQQLLADNSWPNCQGWLHSELGRLAFWRNQIPHSLALYTRAELNFAQVQNEFALAGLCEGLARILIHEGKYTEAQAQLFRSDRWRPTDDHLGRAKRLYHSGRIHRYRGEFAEAVADLEKALDVVRAHVDNRRWEAHIRDVLGDVYLMQGKLADARRQFAAHVFQFKDPVFVVRQKYRMAKLDLAEAKGRRHQVDRVHRIESVIHACDDLITTATTQQLAEKSLRLKALALKELDRLDAAVECLERAARGFADQRANWYVSDCLCETGRIRLQEGDLESSAEAFLAAVQAAVDDIQRNLALDALRTSFQSIDAQHVGAALADLLHERNQLRGERDQLVANFAGFQELMNNITGSMALLGVKRHINFGLTLLESPTSVTEGLEEIRAASGRLASVIGLLRETIAQAAGSDEPWGWCDCFSVCQPLPTEVMREASADTLQSWGLPCHRHDLTKALSELAGFAIHRGESRNGSIGLDFHAKLLRITIDLHGTDLPQDCTLFSLFPLLGHMADWKVDAVNCARLAAACRQVRATGGDVRFTALASGTTAAEHGYRLAVELPVAHRPFPLPTEHSP